jgi:hypothetical protein
MQWFENHKEDTDDFIHDCLIPLMHIFCMFMDDEVEFEFGGAHKLDFYIQGKIQSKGLSNPFKALLLKEILR